MSSNQQRLDDAMAQTQELIQFVRKRMKDEPPKCTVVLKCIKKYRLVHYVHNLIAELLVAWDDAGTDGAGDTQTRRAEINHKVGTTNGWLNEVVKALMECEKSVPPVYDTLQDAESARKGFEEDLGRARDSNVYKLEREYYKAKLLQCDRIIQGWHSGKPPQGLKRSFSQGSGGGRKRQADSDSDGENAPKRPRHDEPGSSTTAANPPLSKGARIARRWLAFPFGTRLASWVRKSKNPAPAPANKSPFPSPVSVVVKSPTPTTKSTSPGTISTTKGSSKLLTDQETLSVPLPASPAITSYIGSPIATPTEAPIPSASVPVPNGKASTDTPPSVPVIHAFTSPKPTRSSPPAAAVATKTPLAVPPSHPTPPPPPTSTTTSSNASNHLTKLAAEYRAFEDFCAANDQPEGATVDTILERATELQKRLTALELYDAMRGHLGVHELQDVRAVVEAQMIEAQADLARAETRDERAAARARLDDLYHRDEDLAAQMGAAVQACDAEYAGWLQAVDGLEKLSNKLLVLQRFGHRAVRGYLGNTARNVQDV